MFDYSVRRTAQVARIGTNETLLVALFVLIIVHVHHLMRRQGNGYNNARADIGAPPLPCGGKNSMPI
jgi:hypothetical protein